MLAPLLANVLFLATDLFALSRMRRGGPRLLLALALGPVVALGFWLAWRTFAWGSIFLLMQLLCWWGFVHLPIVLVLGAARSRHRVPAALLAAAVALVGVDAFLWEPRRLEISHLRLPGPPVTIALVADLQTDRVGPHEERVFAAIAAAGPDLVLFAGDYVQADDEATFTREAARLRELVATLHPRLGGYAVGGDVDRGGWTGIFEGSAITPIPETRTLPVGPLTLTALSVRDARRSDLDLPHADGLHVVLGHAPDFVLGSGRRDLNLAGHTHGGQVRLPFFGPLLTLSAVPRAWAAGPTHLDDGSWLYVSRGIGMERNQAPRLRFNCPPELVFVVVGGD